MHDANAAPSRLQSKVTPDCVSVKTKVAAVSKVGLAGPEVIVGAGGGTAVSAVPERLTCWVAPATFIALSTKMILLVRLPGAAGAKRTPTVHESFTARDEEDVHVVVPLSTTKLADDSVSPLRVRVLLPLFRIATVSRPS